MGDIQKILVTLQSGLGASQVVLVVKNAPGNTRDTVWSLSREDPLEEEMATHSSVFAWEIQLTEEPGEGDP